jgi:hypothetical protein
LQDANEGVDDNPTFILLYDRLYVPKMPAGTHQAETNNNDVASHTPVTINRHSPGWANLLILGGTVPFYGLHFSSGRHPNTLRLGWKMAR